MDRPRLALRRAIERLAGVGRRHRRHDRLDDDLRRHVPFHQCERAVRGDRHDLAVFLALGHRGEPLAHRHFRILPDVREQVFLQREVGNFLEVEGLSSAAQHFHRGLGKRHL